MNINASIVDQRLTGILKEHVGLLEPIVGKDENKQRSLAFVLLCVSTALELPLDTAAELLTEGGNDVGVDALHFSDVEDGEFTVTLFQGKYKHKDLEGTANFPENGVKSAIQTVATLFDPDKQVLMNPRIKPRIEEIRSLIRDGYIPNVRVVLCNNGARWTQAADNWITQSGYTADQVQWVHINHDEIIAVLQRKKSVDDSIQLHGKAIIEDFNFRRVLISKVPITEIAALFERHHDVLLERNIRRYLGLRNNRVNAAIHETLQDVSKRENFYFFNNGITMICRKFRHNALQGENFQVRIDGIQVINGGQTCKTIQQTLKSLPNEDFSNIYVLLRLYELAEDDHELVNDITYATNSQNPVDLRDLRSNDAIQKQLEIGMAELGYTYKRQRDDTGSGANIITSSMVAEAVLAIWRQKPHQAKFLRGEHFGKLYHTIFDNLNAAEAILAVLVFRFVESERKAQAGQKDSPKFLPYASHYIAMTIGAMIMGDYPDVNHKNLDKSIEFFNKFQESIWAISIGSIKMSLDDLYGERDISLQQLSATFRRGDLLNDLVKNLEKTIKLLEREAEKKEKR
ncbi:MAG: AIPR family protein [Thiothrix litoralis]|jgi:hypothetical protein|uniref:AIPR family protein n=1 Tax=Thiothrix litoralis TaxID=2891210 RepID=UPI003C734FDB